MVLTEHSLSELIHIYLCSLNDDTGDALNSFSILPSPVNQCVESYWSKFVVDRPGRVKSFFQDMVDLKIFDTSEPDLLDCIRFRFMSILQKELADIANQWNYHLLSPNRNNTPSGRPDVVLSTPSLWPHLQTTQLVLTLQKPTSLLILPHDKFLILVMRKKWAHNCSFWVFLYLSL